MTEPISPKQFHEAEGTKDLRVVGEGACAWFHTGSFAAGARLVQAIGELGGPETEHPSVDLRSDGVMVRMITTTDDYMGPTQPHIELARQISGVARELGAS